MANAFNAALKKNTKTAAPAKKSGKAKNWVVVGDDIKEAVDNFVVAAKNMKQAKADMAFNEGMIIETVKNQQDKDGFANNYKKSYDVQGDTETVKFVSKNQASINSDDADVLKKMLKKNYDFLIKENTTVTLKPEIFEDDGMQEKLMAMLGDTFAEYFNVETKLSVEEDYDKNVFSVVKDENELAKIRTFVKLYKPAIRG